jgi:flagellin-like hook-associated protein FlgL
LSQTATQPHVLEVRVDGQPTEGQKVTISYALPDGSTGSFDVEATTTSPPERGQFLIGADTDATATNIASAITTQLAHLRDTDLSAASANRASEDLITTGGQPPQRVNGPPFDTATSLVDGTSANTVIWYTGQLTSGSARQTAASRVDESTFVNYGVLANERGLTELVRATAVMASETFQSDVTTDADRYQELTQRQIQRLAAVKGKSGSLEVIALDLGLARASAGSASDRHAVYGSQLETMVADIESVDLNEVAMQLLSVQTSLQASYQTMSTLSQLTLVNFMR